MTRRDGWLGPHGAPNVPWKRRLHVRLAALFAALFLVAGIVVPKLRDELREMLETRAGTPRGASETAIDTVDTAFIVLCLAATAGVAGWVTSQLVTRRLRRMVDTLHRPIEFVGQSEDDPPAPYSAEARRDDEIGALARAINGMHARISELIGDLEEREHDRREWLGRISHDLRTPLTALIACIDRARSAATCLPDGDERALLEDALRVARVDADRFHALSCDLLDVARLERGEGDRVREPVPPIELLRSVATSLRVLAEDLGKTIEIDTARELPELEADGHRLARALENLVRNALQHGESVVVLSAERAGAAIQFAVCDDGPGLPLDDAGRVDFDDLARSPGRREGTGIGLLVAREVAAAHGGELGGTNRDGGGALVWMRIPLPNGDHDARP